MSLCQGRLWAVGGGGAVINEEGCETCYRDKYVSTGEGTSATIFCFFASELLPGG